MKCRSSHLNYGSFQLCLSLMFLKSDSLKWKYVFVCVNTFIFVLILHVDTVQILLVCWCFCLCHVFLLQQFSSLLQFLFFNILFSITCLFVKELKPWHSKHHHREPTVWNWMYLFRVVCTTFVMKPSLWWNQGPVYAGLKNPAPPTAVVSQWNSTSQPALNVAAETQKLDFTHPQLNWAMKRGNWVWRTAPWEKKALTRRKCGEASGRVKIDSLMHVVFLCVCVCADLEV